MVASVTRRLILPVVLLAVLTGCGGDPEPAAARAPSAATSSAPSSPSPSPSASTLYKPTLPTTMTADGGSCVSKGKCGYYVAGASCGKTEWCTKGDLVEPGLWRTLGGESPTECGWAIVERGGLEYANYATGWTEIPVPEGAVFHVRSCPNEWTWVHS